MIYTSKIYFQYFHYFLDCEKLLCFRYYEGTTLDYIAQSDPLIIKHPVEKLKKLIKIKRHKYGGIENDAFQDEGEHTPLPNSNSLEDLDSSKESVCTGVKKKSPNGMCPEAMGGTKKKIRAKTCLNSPPNKEYFQIWNASNSPSPDSEGKKIYFYNSQFENIISYTPTRREAGTIKQSTSKRPLL